MTSEIVSVKPLGDRALVLKFKPRPSRDLTRVMAAWVHSIGGVEGVVEVSQGYRTILIETLADLREPVERFIAALTPDPAAIDRNQVVIEVRYDGIDLEWCANSKGTSVADLIRIHTSTSYDVVTLGSPGFIYLSEVDPRIAIARRPMPRPMVAAGSVGIGGMQTGIYGLDRPGGWQVIGSVVGAIPKMQPGDTVLFSSR